MNTPSLYEVYNSIYLNSAYTKHTTEKITEIMGYSEQDYAVVKQHLDTLVLANRLSVMGQYYYYDIAVNIGIKYEIPETVTRHMLDRFLDSVCAEITIDIELNDSMAAYLNILKFVGSIVGPEIRSSVTALLQVLSSIETIHKYERSLPPGLIQTRDYYYKQVLKLASSVLDETDYNKIISCL